MERASLKVNRAANATGFEQHRRKTAGANRRFYAAGAVIVVAAVALAFVAMQGSSVYYVSIGEFNGKQVVANYAGKEVRVAGKVIPGSILRNSDRVSFTARDKADPSQIMQVSYSRLIPDTFKDDAEVVVTGTYNNGVFTATEMLAKCPSKYSSEADTSTK